VDLGDPRRAWGGAEEPESASEVSGEAELIWESPSPKLFPRRRFPAPALLFRDRESPKYLEVPASPVIPESPRVPGLSTSPEASPESPFACPYLGYLKEGRVFWRFLVEILSSEDSVGVSFFGALGEVMSLRECPNPFL
jgi:hypothetical protein